MSFAQLKSARKTKESQSFVKAETSGDSILCTPVVAPHPNDDVPESPFKKDEANFDNATVPQMQLDDQSPERPGLHSFDTDGGSSSASQTEAISDVDPQVRVAAPQLSDLPKSRTEKGATKPTSLHGCHVALPTTLEIRESNKLGRGVYAKSALSVGSVIMSILPHVAVISSPNLDQHCSACAGPAPASGLKRCPKCKTIYYCNSECQNRDWVGHKRECSALQRWAAGAPSRDVAVPGEAVRCLGRILWGCQKEGLDSVWAKEIRMMHSNRSSLQPSAYDSHTHMAHSLVRLLGVSSPQELEPYGLTSAGDLVDLISRFSTNTFTLTDPALNPIGICVAPIVALANHSCDPNAVIVFPRTYSKTGFEPLLHLVALRDIAPGKEVRISYVDTTLPKSVRQKELKETYDFACQCTLCTRAMPAEPREALWCPKGCGGICPHPSEENAVTRCVKCKAAIINADAVLDTLRVGQDALEKASSLELKDPAIARQLTTNIIPILTSAGVTPSSHPLLALTQLHQELLIASLDSASSPSQFQETLDEAIRAAAKYSAGLQNLLPKGHPVRAVALGELGKLLAVDELAPPPPSKDSSNSATIGKFPPSGPPRLKLAYESMVRAHEEMLIGFGKSSGGGQLGRDMRDAIVRLEKELGVWTTGIKSVLEDTVKGRMTSPVSR